MAGKDKEINKLKLSISKKKTKLKLEITFLLQNTILKNIAPYQCI